MLHITSMKCRKSGETIVRFPITARLITHPLDNQTENLPHPIDLNTTSSVVTRVHSYYQKDVQMCGGLCMYGDSKKRVCSSKRATPSVYAAITARRKNLNIVLLHISNRFLQHWHSIKNGTTLWCSKNKTWKPEACIGFSWTLRETQSCELPAEKFYVAANINWMS